MVLFMTLTVLFSTITVSFFNIDGLSTFTVLFTTMFFKNKIYNIIYDIDSLIDDIGALVTTLAGFF